MRFFQDVVISMLDEGCVAIVPVDTTKNPNITDSYDILTMRTGKIIEWYPDNIKVELYNDKIGNKEDIVISKKNVAIIENPFYEIMNEPNSTLQRLVRKLALLDSVDEQSSSGKLDLIIQLPYIIKSEARKKQADERRKEIEDEMDELWLDEDEKEEVRSGDYSPEDFGEEDLEEDDYYYEDDN